MLKDLLQGKPLRHPLHPLLVHFPIALFVLSLLLDLTSLAAPEVDGLAAGAFYSMVFGLATALLAAVPGIVDYTDIRRDSAAKRTANYHLALNLLVVALYSFNLGLRFEALAEQPVPLVPLILSLAGVAILAVSGYLGGRMIYDDGVGVGRHRRPFSAPRETIRLSAAAPSPGAPREPAHLNFVALPEAERLADGETLRVEIDGEVLTVAKVDGECFAFQEFCTHRYGPLSEGSFQDGQVQCPWHRSCFDVRTGAVTHGPAKMDLQVRPVVTQEGRIWIGVPKREEPKG